MEQGEICGTVVHARDRVPLPGAEVVLLVRVEREFTPIAQTTSDAHGAFLFRDLPVGEAFEYRVGANRDGIHYPGARLRLTPLSRTATARVTVHDAVSYPSPLVARRHEVLISAGSGSVEVTETIVVENPDDRCYVGMAATGDAEPVTLHLSIPPEFQRVTFEKEFFGRRFRIAGTKLATSVPWMPGQRELKFTYTLSPDSSGYSWQRPLDLPCRQLSVRVRAARPGEVSANLGIQPSRRGEEVIFEVGSRTLPAGQVVRVSIGRLPVPLMAYGRWLAVAMLAGAIGGTSFFTARRARRMRSPTENHPAIRRPEGVHDRKNRAVAKR